MQVELFKKDQSRIHMLRRLRSFGVCWVLLRTLYDTVVASVIFYAVMCWREEFLKGTKKILLGRPDQLWDALCPLLITLVKKGW